MKQLRFLGLVVVPTWLVHVVLVSGYAKLFADTHSLVFRLLYAVELSLTFSCGIYFYLRKVDQPLAKLAVVLLVVGYLAVIDGLLSLTIPSVRTMFDIWHFAAAYSLLAVSLVVVYRQRVRR
ncbi:MAG: hypothetical protein QFB87_04855 [Patescibacteria group bacterium]|nr:hypothetical protein [Patescibacteria group bacterium]